MNRKRGWPLVFLILIVLSLMSWEMIGLGPGETQQATTAPGEYSISAQGKQIDEVWLSVGSILGIGNANERKVWDPAKRGWFSFEVVYAVKGVEEPIGFRVDTSNEKCNAEAEKLVQAAEAIKEWDDWSVDDSTCSEKPGCCGSYTWWVFDYAIGRLYLGVSWPLTACNGYKQCWDPVYIEGYTRFTKNDITKPDFKFMPGDMVYYMGLKEKCAYNLDSHIQIIGNPGSNGKLQLIDFGSRARGIHELSWEEYYSTRKFGKCNIREAITEVYRVIPECKQP